MIRKVSYLATGALLGATALAGLQSITGATANAAGSDTYRQLSVFGDIFERVRASYVSEPEDKELIRAAINGMLTSLDPHSSYLDPEEARDMQVQTSGEFGGLGIEVTMENELVKVITPIDGTPAAKAGVLSGDFISEIDGKAVRGLTLPEAVDKMRGPVNTPIELTLIREGADAPIKVTIVREIIKVKAVRARVEGPDIGYLRVMSFTEQTYDNLKAEIDKITAELGEENIKGWVLDLRLNPGGLLNQAINVSDAFLTRGEVVSTRGRNPKDIQRYDSRPGDLVNGKPVIVLVNGGSASASEIVAGALQDHRRATVLGTRSFGKGSVQTIIPLGENGSLRLTTALYYTPSGNSIQGKGIEPDIKVEQPLPPELTGRDVTRGESELEGHIEGENEDEEGSGSAAYVPPEAKDDLQLQHALKLIRGELKDPAFPPPPSAEVKTDASKG
ncbi:MAG: S41 family peptidase [Rhizobiaceae bacterium]|jgi:carboxyl-terminal processing protease|nr:S41 family peptidase [Rhizobiaceae bacterium]